MTRLEHLPPLVRAAIGARLLVDGWHLCPGRCGATISPGHVGCRDCWLRVPRPLRQPLSDTFPKRLTRPDDYRAAVARAWDLIGRHSPHPQEQP